MAATKLESMLVELGLEVDESTLKILSILQKKKNVPEEDIAKKLKLRINDARKLLYKLYEKRLAVYEKKSDPKKKWWYIYYWNLDKGRIQELFLEFRRKEIVKKKEELEAELKYAFECKGCKAKYQYEAALETEFTCPTCGSVLEQAAATMAARKLRREITDMEKNLAKEEAKIARAQR
jgi:transcription initiation factor TFIIE subunit alpha